MSEFEEVLSSLKYFFEKIMYSAKNDGDWCIKSFHKAHGWSVYCEEELKNPNIHFALEIYLNSMDSCGYTIQDVKSLKKLLISTLLMNHLVSSDVIKAVVDVAIEEFGEESTSKMLRQAKFKIKDYQYVIKELRTNKNMENNFNTFKVRLLIESVSNGSLPQSALSKILKKSENLSSILTLVESLNNLEGDKILACIGDYLKQELNKCSNNSILILLSSLSDTHFKFLCDKFPNMLESLLKAVNIIGNPLSCEEQDKLLNDSYISIIKILKILINSPFSIQTSTVMSSWFMTNQGHFWHHVLQNVNSN